MPATPITVDTLEHEIAHEERIVGIPTDQPLTHAAIVKRHVQIGVLLGLLSLAVVATLVSSLAALRLFSCALALAFGVYAWIEGKHLERLARLQRDESSIHLTVADSLLRSGILCADRDRARPPHRGRARRQPARGRRAQRRAVGVRRPAAGRPVGRDPARRGVRRRRRAASGSTRGRARRAARHEPVRRGAQRRAHGHRGAARAPGRGRRRARGGLGRDRPLQPVDELLVSAFARGAVAALLSGGPRRSSRGRRRFHASWRSLEGRVAVITGGGSGIGAATARRFAAEGATRRRARPRRRRRGSRRRRGRRQGARARRARRRRGRPTRSAQIVARGRPHRRARQQRRHRRPPAAAHRRRQALAPADRREPHRHVQRDPRRGAAHARGRRRRRSSTTRRCPA